MEEKVEAPETPSSATDPSTTSSTTSSTGSNDALGVLGAQAAAADAAARRQAPQDASEPVAPSSDPSFRLEILKLAYTADRAPDQVLDAAKQYLEWING
jgi:hypothetical protein